MRTDPFVALLGTGARITDGDAFLPIPARAIQAQMSVFGLAEARCVAY